MMMLLSHEEFLRRSVQCNELIAFARTLAWPKIAYLSPFGRRCPIDGDDQWLGTVFSSCQSRRDAWRQLVTIECQRIHAGVE